MAVAARREAREYYAPVTRVYSHSAASTAPAIDPNIYGHPEQAPKIDREAERRARLLKKHRLLLRLASVCAVLAALSALLFIMVRYEKISGEYAAVNELKKDIEETRLNLDALNVSLQYAVTLDEARAAAERLGMVYPQAGQFVRADSTNAAVSPDEAD
jgi:hypothetical protein